MNQFDTFSSNNLKEKESKESQNKTNIRIIEIPIRGFSSPLNIKFNLKSPK